MQSALTYTGTWHHQHQPKASPLGGLASPANTVEAVRLLLMMMAAQKSAKAEASVTEWDDVQIHGVAKRSCVTVLNMASGSGPPRKKFRQTLLSFGSKYIQESCIGFRLAKSNYILTLNGVNHNPPVHFHHTHLPTSTISTVTDQ